MSEDDLPATETNLLWIQLGVCFKDYLEPDHDSADTSHNAKTKMCDNR